MSRYIGPSCRLCRREGQKLFLKGTRCYTPKCAFERRDTPPGMHGRRRGKRSEYNIQLREKQKVRRMYGMQEKQFSLFFQKAQRMDGNTGENLLIMLETRVDSIVYYAGFATSRAMARQLVNHGLVTVNGKKMTIPSYRVKAGDVVGCKEKDSAQRVMNDSLEELGEGYVVPEWIQLDRQGKTATITRMPSREDVSMPINESLIVELYSK